MRGSSTQPQVVSSRVHRHPHEPIFASADVRVWVELSGEHPTLPRAEALAAFEAERVEIRSASWSRNLLRVDAAGPVERALFRLGLAHVVCEEIARGGWEDIRRAAREVDLEGKMFRVRARGLGVDLDKEAVEGALGADFGRTGKVNLSRPDVDFRVLAGPEFLLGRVVHHVDRAGLEARKVTHRTFSLPISLHPKFCRAAVNLARAPSGGVVLDPFCGTGGILLEAARMGMDAVGADLRRTMVEGARASLRDLHADASFAVADAGRGPWRPSSIDAVATDPPYGRAASTRGEPTLRLYARAAESVADALRRGGHLAAVLPNEDAVRTFEERFSLVERHELRVHRSLTRIFCAFVSSP